MLYTRVDLHQSRIIVNKIKHFVPGEVIATSEASVHLADEFQIFGRVYRPAVIAEVGGVMEQGNIESTWRCASLQCSVFSDQFYAFIKVWHNMLTVLRFSCLLPGAFQNLECTNFSI